MPNPRDDRLAEDLILECLESSDPPSTVEQKCREYPALADELRQRFALLRATGMVGTVPGETTATPPVVTPRGSGDWFGEFKILRELGRGGMGVVFLAEQPALKRRVALKVIRSDILNHPRAVLRFRREVEAASRLDHPGICTVFAAGDVDGAPYLAMRYLEGESLAQRLRRAKSEPGSQPSSTDEVRAQAMMMEKVARAAHLAHESGLVHRDIKPSNIMLVDDEPVLLDFGLSTDSESGSDITLSGDQVGTPAYMAPEQIAGRRSSIDRRTDVYALGVTLFECLVHRLPFTAPTVQALYHDILNSELPDSSRMNSAIPGSLRVILETAMAREPRARYATALDFADDLARFIADKPIAARPPSLTSRAMGLLRRNRTLTAAVLLVLATTTTAAIISTQAALKAGRAETRLSGQLEETQAAQARAEAQAVRSAALTDELLGVAVSMTEEFIDRLDPKFASLELQRDFAKTAVDTLETVTTLSRADPRVQAALARAHLRFAKTAGNPVGPALMDLEGAQRSVERAHELATALSEAHPSASEWLILLADTTCNMGLVTRRNASLEEALRYFDDTIELLAAADALAPLAAADRFAIANTLRYIGITHGSVGRWPLALAAFERAIPTVEQVIREDPDNFVWQVERTISRSLVASAQGRSGQTTEALATQMAVRSEFKALAADRPDDDKVWNLYLTCRMELSHLQRVTGALDEAEAQYREVLIELERRSNATPGVANLQRKTIGVLHELGLLHRDRASLPDALLVDRLADLEEAVNVMRQSIVAIDGLIQQGGAERSARPLFDQIRRDTENCEARLAKLRLGG